MYGMVVVSLLATSHLGTFDKIQKLYIISLKKGFVSCSILLRPDVAYVAATNFNSTNTKRLYYATVKQKHFLDLSQMKLNDFQEKSIK